MLVTQITANAGSLYPFKKKCVLYQFTWAPSMPGLYPIMKARRLIYESSRGYSRKMD